MQSLFFRWRRIFPIFTKCSYCAQHASSFIHCGHYNCDYWYCLVFSGLLGPKMVIVTDIGYPKTGLWVLEVMPWRNGVLGKLNKAFLLFLPIFFGIFGDFSKFYSAFGMLHFKKIIKYTKNLA